MWGRNIYIYIYTYFLYWKMFGRNPPHLRFKKTKSTHFPQKFLEFGFQPIQFKLFVRKHPN